MHGLSQKPRLSATSLLLNSRQLVSGHCFLFSLQNSVSATDARPQFREETCPLSLAPKLAFYLTLDKKHELPWDILSLFVRWKESSLPSAWQGLTGKCNFNIGTSIFSARDPRPCLHSKQPPALFHVWVQWARSSRLFRQNISPLRLFSRIRTFLTHLL